MDQLALWEAPKPSVANEQRWYQQEAYDRIVASLKRNRSTLYVAATGTGKTQVFCAVARDWPGRVLVLVHRTELAEQAINRLEAMTGERVELEKADSRADLSCRLVVASVDTIKSSKRLHRWPPGHFGLVIVDEAHHYIAKTYRKPIDYFASAKVLGVTATPDRGDAKALGAIFDDVAYVFDILDAVEAGYLVPIEGKSIDVGKVDISNVKTVSGDLDACGLDAVMAEHSSAIAEETLKFSGERQGIIFMPKVRTAELAASMFNARKPGCCEVISGGTPPDVRADIVERFRAGKFQFLSNCAIATEGFDAPNVSIVVLGRPTKSRALATQMVGRGTRVLPGAIEQHQLKGESAHRKYAIAHSEKPTLTVLDFVRFAGTHSLVTPEDILGGQFSDREVAEAKAIAKQKKGGNAVANLLAAREKLRQLAEKAKKVTVVAQVRAFDPFVVAGLSFTEESRYQQFSSPAMQWQVAELNRRGVENVDLANISKKAATQLIDQLRQRQTLGLCTYRHLRQLQRFGITDRNISYEAGNAAMTYLVRHNWGNGPAFDKSELLSITKGPRAG